MGYPRGTKTEHSGAKKAKGYWGRKAEAKKVSRRLRRIADRKLSREE